jgi:hypothetical protein
MCPKIITSSIDCITRAPAVLAESLFSIILLVGEPILFRALRVASKFALLISSRFLLAIYPSSWRLEVVRVVMLFLV